jgi:hypothetical protein
MADLPIACTLTADAPRCGAADLLPGLAAEADAVQAAADGVRLEFAAGASGVVTRIAGVIERERRCCQFLHFRLEVSAGSGPITLALSGPPGTGAFLAGLHPAFAPPAGRAKRSRKTEA